MTTITQQISDLKAEIHDMLLKLYDSRDEAERRTMVSALISTAEGYMTFTELKRWKWLWILLEKPR